MAIILIGIDDTDNLQSDGTGRLARRLAEVAAARGAKWLGNTRHQLLFDERIPCTRQNRGICMAVEWGGAIEQLRSLADSITAWSVAGSDPGICFAPAESVGKAVLEWGERATREIVSMAEAERIAEGASITLLQLGGSGLGIVGALACVGLRAGGNDGRFVDLPGLRDLGECVTREELARLGIKIEHRGPARASEVYRTLGWVRPRLVGGEAVWPVEWSEQDHAWISIDRKKIRNVEPA
jgi:hypothetical protein